MLPLMSEAPPDKHEAAQEQCIGPILYTGTIYHGMATHAPEEVLLRSLPYRHTFTVDYARDGSLGKLEDATLGPGLYCTTTPDRAQQYAKHKSHQLNREVPAVTSLTLQEVPLYDFRSKSDPTHNAPVSPEMARAWSQYFEDNFPTISLADSQNMGVQNTFADYRHHLKNVVYGTEHGLPDQYMRPYDVHSLLGTLDDQPASGMGASPLWGGLWVRFLEQTYGTKGIIAVQYGEDSSWDAGASVVLMDLTPDILSTQQHQLG